MPQIREKNVDFKQYDTNTKNGSLQKQTIK